METERGFSSYADTQSEPPSLECAREEPDYPFFVACEPSSPRRTIPLSWRISTNARKARPCAVICFSSRTSSMRNSAMASPCAANGATAPAASSRSPLLSSEGTLFGERGVQLLFVDHALLDEDVAQLRAHLHLLRARQAHELDRGAAPLHGEQRGLAADSRPVTHRPGGPVRGAGIQVQLVGGRFGRDRRSPPVDGAAARLPDLAEDPDRRSPRREQRDDARIPDVLPFAHVQGRS